MQNKFNFLLFFTIIFIFCSQATNAIDRVAAKEDTTSQQGDHLLDSMLVADTTTSQLAFGFSQRVDNRQLINFSPMTHLKYYYRLTEKLTGKFGVGYSASSKFKSLDKETIQYRNLKFEIGFKWNLIKSIVTLYHENGFEYNYYYEAQSKIWDQRIGMNISFGLNYKIDKKYMIDIAIGRTLNDGDFSATKIRPLDSSPVGIYNGRFFNELFNPISVQLLIIKNL